MTRGQQERTFDTAIFSAPPNAVEGPVKTQFGYYVFKVTKITPASQQTLAQATPTIQNLLRSQRQQTALTSFVKSFQKRHKADTTCQKGFEVAQECSNAPKSSSSSSSTPASGGSPGGGATQGATPQGATPQGATPQGAPPQGATPQGATPQGATPQGATPQGATPQGATPQGATPQGGSSSGGAP